ncbi:MAG: formylglycine-generating enzyme family protein, partial [Treponema sp.]|nr:formylglycine-generating enzyme family protein [Treponema sp.]
DISPTSVIGGLVGVNRGTVSNCFTTGTVTGSANDVGGMVGRNFGRVENSYSTSNVTGINDVGGVAGLNGEGAVVENSYTTGAVTGNIRVGGVVGGNASTVLNSYATGSVTGNDNVGGVVGGNIAGYRIENCVALNPVITSSGTGTNFGRVTGGIVAGTITGNRARSDMIFIDVNPTVTPDPNGIHGENLAVDGTVPFTTAFAGWDALIWNIPAGNLQVNRALPTLAGVGGNQSPRVNSWIEMVWIPAGSFTRDGYEVTLTNGFYMGKYQVTQELYQTVMGTNPSLFTTANSRPPAAGEMQGRRPVERVSWYDAIVFCNRLSMLEGLSPAYEIQTATDTAIWSTDPTTWGAVPASSDTRWNSVRIVSGSTGYRLPTEAQWEYACRAGSTTLWHFGDTESDLVNYAWYSANSDSRTRQVGLKLPNQWGLHDKHGNVFEWVWDWSGEYLSTPQTDPIGAASGTIRVARGGSWSLTASDAQSAVRNGSNPVYSFDFLGFRLALP